MTTKLSLAAITAALCASAVLSSNAMAHNAMAQVACGDTITRHAQLTADIIACGSNPALTVVGPAHLDLNGFEVTCSDNMVDVGIMLDGKRARLNDGEVTGCATGVLAAGKGKHHISGVKASANVIGFIAESSRNHFKRNQSVDNTQHGFSDHGGNTYFNNTADRNRRNGFDGKDGSHYVKNSASFNKENGFDVENNNNPCLSG